MDRDSDINNQAGPEQPSEGGILDVVFETEQAHQIANFNPDSVVADILNQLKEREQRVLMLRYGLMENKAHTLEAIGEKLNITRERVRQIEKDSIGTIKKKEINRPVRQSLDIIKKTIADHGGIFGQDALVEHLLVSNKNERQVNALLFLLDFSDYFHFLEESDLYHPAWHIEDFQKSRLDEFYQAIKEILEQQGKPLELNSLKESFRSTPVFQKSQEYFNDRVVENFLIVTRHFKSNPFGEYGLHNWRDIMPRDVGDKAHLVLKHAQKPLHYTKLTELINQHRFDERTAYKETVHNELIMDPRFVLVGRGIYALADWGYKKGLVADVIKDILQSASEPLEREKIIEEVGKQRLVRRNTILVGLANKKLFRRVGKNRYELA